MLFVCLTAGSIEIDGAFDRSRSEYVSQLISDIASYYGYNEFLAEKLFQLFPVSEVCDLLSSIK